CHIGLNEQMRIGKNLVHFLSTYMPHLRTLRLWRSDDFPWISITITITITKKVILRFLKIFTAGSYIKW
ncbi:unnamed protein product, partial [Rotaria sp. Silwood1]